MPNHLLYLVISFLTLLAHSADRPNILMIVVDDLADYPLAPKFNQVKTPNLDRFASSALSFTKAFCTSPICNPSRSSVISGMAPHRTGVTINSMRWEKTPILNECVGFPELFKKNGYRTMWSGKLWHGTATPGEEKLDQWFDEHDRHRSFGPVSKEHAKTLEGISLKKNAALFGMKDVPDSQWQDTGVADDTIRRLQQTSDQPFLMVCGFVRPHTPWTAPKRFFDLYERDQIELPPWKADDMEDVPDAVQEVLLHQYDWDLFMETGLWKDVIHAYLACISFVDWNIGRVLDALENSPHADNTIVVFWSDHGFHMGEKSYFCKNALWDQTTRTPFLIRLPGMANAGSQCDEVVSLLDIYPSLVDLCKLSGVPTGQLDGQSLLPLITGTGQWNRQTALMSLRGGNHALRSDHYRYIRYEDGSEELYDARRDPNEFTNLARLPEHREVLAHMRTALKQKVGDHPPVSLKKKKSKKKNR